MNSPLVSFIKEKIRQDQSPRYPQRNGFFWKMTLSKMARKRVSLRF